MGERWRSLPFENDGWLLRIGSQHTGGRHGDPRASGAFRFSADRQSSFRPSRFRGGIIDQLVPDHRLPVAFSCGSGNYALGVGSQRA